ncbi:MAG: hypothetical protein ABSB39_02885 [Candidatus Sulfotelmatobacter sp.]
MSVKKKAKADDEEKAKKSAKKRVRISKKPVDMARVRETIKNMVGNSAEKIAAKVINVALTGQLAPAKYLFEAAGLYPATEETAARPQGDSLAHILLRRMGLPLESVIQDEEEDPLVVAIDAKGMSTEARKPGAAEDSEAESEEEQGLVPESAEE